MVNPFPNNTRFSYPGEDTFENIVEKGENPGY